MAWNFPGAGGGGAATGMTIVEKEINTTDATQTSFGALFTPAANSASLCNIRILSVEQVAGGGDWASFQWLGAVVHDTDGDGVYAITNGTASTAPDNSQGAGGAAVRLAILGGSALEIKITGIAASNYRHRLVLEYSSLVYS